MNSPNNSISFLPNGLWEYLGAFGWTAKTDCSRLTTHHFPCMSFDFLETCPSIRNLDWIYEYPRCLIRSIFWYQYNQHAICLPCSWRSYFTNFVVPPFQEPPQWNSHCLGPSTIIHQLIYGELNPSDEPTPASLFWLINIPSLRENLNRKQYVIFISAIGRIR